MVSVWLGLGTKCTWLRFGRYATSAVVPDINQFLFTWPQEVLTGFIGRFKHLNQYCLVRKDGEIFHWISETF